MKFNNKKAAFTLAEVVVVMAILGVMMAAFAPVVTKRSVSSNNNFKNFTLADGHTGLFYGTTNDQKSVIIGDNSIENSAAFDPKLLLISNTFTDGTTANTITPAIGFGYNDASTSTSYSGQLTMLKTTDATDYGSLVLGGKPNTNYTTATLKKNTTIIGLNACEGNTAENVLCIGTRAGIQNNVAPDRIFIGNRDTAYTAGNIYFGNTTLDSIITSYGTPSDIRLKNVGKEFKGGLDEINQLTFYNYTYKRDAEKTPRVGVMAQDLQKVFPNAVNENSEGYLYIRKDDMFFASINAIKELFVKMTDNSAKIKELEERNAVLEKQVKELQDLYIDLAKKVDKKAANKKLTITPEKPAVEEVETAPAEEN